MLWEVEIAALDDASGANLKVAHVRMKDAVFGT